MLLAESTRLLSRLVTTQVASAVKTEGQWSFERRYGCFLFWIQETILDRSTELSQVELWLSLICLANGSPHFAKEVVRALQALSRETIYEHSFAVVFDSSRQFVKAQGGTEARNIRLQTWDARPRWKNCGQLMCFTEPKLDIQPMIPVLRFCSCFRIVSRGKSDTTSTTITEMLTHLA